ncbi:hypothetical protein [Streptomyces sp. NPDC048277]
MATGKLLDVADCGKRTAPTCGSGRGRSTPVTDRDTACGADVRPWT